MGTVREVGALDAAPGFSVERRAPDVMLSNGMSCCLGAIPKGVGALEWILSGIGNAYSDEILHAARLSPLLLTQKLDEDQWSRLFGSVWPRTLDWLEALRRC